MKSYSTALFVVLSICVCYQTGADDRCASLDNKHEEYAPRETLTGKAMLRGRENSMTLMSLLKQEFVRFHPNLDLYVSAEFSVPGLYLPPGDRVMIHISYDDFSDPRVKKETEKHDYVPASVPIYIEMIGVVVHKENPIEALTLPELKATYSHRDGNVDIKTWGQLGLEGDWKNRPIAPHAVEFVSSTGGFFAAKVLSDNTPKKSVKEHKTGHAVREAVSTDKNAIGFTTYCFIREDVKFVPLALNKDTMPLLPGFETGRDMHYPLTRIGRIIFKGRPETELHPIQKAFLEFAYSRQGQRLLGHADSFRLVQDRIKEGERH